MEVARINTSYFANENYYPLVPLFLGGGGNGIGSAEIRLSRMRQRKVLYDNEWTGWLQWMKTCFQRGTMSKIWKRIQEDGDSSVYQASVAQGLDSSTINLT